MNGNKSSIFMNWLKNFTIMVFTQSFHAVFMVFILEMMSAVAADNNGQVFPDRTTGVLSIVSIAGAMALIKFEKIIKDLFGIGDSKFMGDLGKNFAKTAAGIGSAVRMGQRTVEPYKKKQEAKARKAKLEKDNPWLLEKSGVPNTGSSGSSLTNINNDVSNTTNTNNAADNNPENVPSGNSTGNLTDLIAALNNNTNALATNTQFAKDEKEEKIRKEYEDVKEEAESKLYTKQLFTRAGTTIASLGVGLGATDEFSEALTVANLVDMPLDKMTDRGVKKAVYKSRSRELEKEIADSKAKLNEAKSKNNKDDVTRLEKSIKKLEDAKVAIDDKVPASLRSELASLWKDVKVEINPKNSINYNAVKFAEQRKADRNKLNSNSVDDI